MIKNISGGFYEGKSYIDSGELKILVKAGNGHKILRCSSRQAGQRLYNDSIGTFKQQIQSKLLTLTFNNCLLFQNSLKPADSEANK